MLMRLFTAKQRQNCPDILSSLQGRTTESTELRTPILVFHKNQTSTNVLTNVSAWSINIRDAYRIFGEGTKSVFGSYCTSFVLY